MSWDRAKLWDGDECPSSRGGWDRVPWGLPWVPKRGTQLSAHSCARCGRRQRPSHRTPYLRLARVRLQVGGSQGLAPNPKAQPAPGEALSPPTPPLGSRTGCWDTESPSSFWHPGSRGSRGGVPRSGGVRQAEFWGGVRCSPQAPTSSFLCDSKSSPGASCSHAGMGTGLAEATDPHRDGHEATGAPGGGRGTAGGRLLTATVPWVLPLLRDQGSSWGAGGGSAPIPRQVMGSAWLNYGDRSRLEG